MARKLVASNICAAFVTSSLTTAPTACFRPSSALEMVSLRVGACGRTGVCRTPALGIITGWIPLSEVPDLAAFAPWRCASIPTA